MAHMFHRDVMKMIGAKCRVTTQREKQVFEDQAVAERRIYYKKKEYGIF